MPEPRPNENKDDFVSRCVPVVIADGTADNTDQAVAVCSSIYEQKSKKMSFDAGAPASAMRFDAELEFGDNGEDAKSAPVRMLARTFAFVHPYWGKVEHDFAGMKHRNRIPLDYCHDSRELVGYANKFDVGDDGLVLGGALTPYKDDRASEIIHKARQGVPYQASIDFRGPVAVESVHSGETVEVNGHEFEGPGVIIRKWQLKGCAVCPHGADSSTASAVFAEDGGTYEITEFESENEEQEQIMKEEAEVPETVEAELEAEAVEAVEAEGAEAVEAVDAESETPEEGVENAAEAVSEEDEAVEAQHADNSPVDAASVAKQYLDAYGEAGLKWLAEGRSFEECGALYVAKLEADNKELSERLEAVRLGEKPLQASAPAADTNIERPIPETLRGGERAIFTQLKMPF